MVDSRVDKISVSQKRKLLKRKRLRRERLLLQLMRKQIKIFTLRISTIKVEKPITPKEGLAILIGTQVGAGVLGLPYAASKVGLIPGFGILIGVMLLMLFTALIVLKLSAEMRGAQMSTIAQRTLGKAGGWTMYLSIVLMSFGALLAYVAGMGSVFASLFGFNETIGGFIFWILASRTTETGTWCGWGFRLIRWALPGNSIRTSACRSPASILCRTNWKPSTTIFSSLRGSAFCSPMMLEPARPSWRDCSFASSNFAGWSSAFLSSARPTSCSNGNASFATSSMRNLRGSRVPTSVINTELTNGLNSRDLFI